MTGAIGALASASTAVTGYVAITNQTISKRRISTTATAGYSINSSGNVVDQGATILEAWLHGGSAASYDVMVTPLSGVALTGTTGTWLNCASTRTWSISNSTPDDSTLSAQFTVQIRLTATGIVQTSATVTLNATCASGA